MRVPKIKVGLDGHGKSKFELGNTNTTSTSFGIGQPIYGQELIPGSNVKVHESAWIRLSSMVLPSFCRSLKYITESTFVPYENLCKTYSLMKSEQPYTTAVGTTYYPKETPTTDLHFLTSYLLSKHTYWTAYYSNTGTIEDGEINLEDAHYIQDTNVSDINILKSYLDEHIFSKYLADQGGISTTRYAGNSDWHVSIENADFLLPFTSSSGRLHVIAFLFDAEGRQFRKVLNGLGYKLSMSGSKKSILPLFAYYKAYFDRNISHRYARNWENTYAYQFLYQSMEKNVTYISSSNYSQSLSAIYDSFYYFLRDELCDTYYYLDPDYYTVQLNTLSNPQSSFSLAAADQGEGASDTTITTMGSGDNPFVAFPSEMGITATAIRQVLALQQYSNKSKLLGGLVSQYMYVHGLGKYLENHGCKPVSTQYYDISVSDINVTANSNADGNLSVVGDYAGKGVGSGSGKYEFSTDVAGYFVIIGYIVPTSGFFQGVDPCLDHYDKTSFYEPAFDSLGYVLTPQEQFYVNDVLADGVTRRQGFGYLPAYYEYKTKPQNIVNGDVSLRSRRNNLLPYTLDRFISDVVVSSKPVTGSTGIAYKIQFHKSNAFIADASLRAVGRAPSLDNYDRIFYNSGKTYIDPDYHDTHPMGIDDNFVIHHIFDVQCWAPMLGASFSFDTEADKNQNVDVTQE